MIGSPAVVETMAAPMIGTTTMGMMSAPVTTGAAVDVGIAQVGPIMTQAPVNIGYSEPVTTAVQQQVQQTLIQEVTRQVAVPQIQNVERVVEIPQLQVQERLVEVPQLQVQE